MKKLLLFLLMPAGFIGAMQRPGQPVQATNIGTTLLEVHNQSQKDLGIFIIRADNSKVGPITIMAMQRWPANIPINKGDKLYIASEGKRLAPYTPSGRTPFIDLIIHPDNKAEIRPAGE